LPAEERIELATEQGARRIDFPYREPMVTGTSTTYRTFSGTQELLVVIDEIPCNDTLSGEAFQSTVGVTLESMTMYGCGQPP
jgi:putative lipoprotein